MVEASDILKCLPHSYPMVMVDRITELDEGTRGVGIKSVTANEDCFRGHFPGNPIMPGVLIIECMTQTAGVVFGYRRGEPAGRIPGYLAMIEHMRFRKNVIPGDELVIEVKLIRRFGRMTKISAEARVEGEVVASGTLTLAR